MITVTVDDAIAKLALIRQHSHLGGNTVLHLCVDDLELIPIEDLVLFNDEDGKGAVVEVQTKIPDNFFSLKPLQ